VLNMLRSHSICSVFPKVKSYKRCRKLFCAEKYFKAVRLGQWVSPPRHIARVATRALGSPLSIFDYLTKTGLLPFQRQQERDDAEQTFLESLSWSATDLGNIW